MARCGGAAADKDPGDDTADQIWPPDQALAVDHRAQRCRVSPQPSAKGVAGARVVVGSGVGVWTASGGGGTEERGERRFLLAPTSLSMAWECGQGMDSPATPTDFSPLLSLVPRNESCYKEAMALDHNSAGDRELGRAIREHQRGEDNDANSPVQRTTTNDGRRRDPNGGEVGTTTAVAFRRRAVATEGWTGFFSSVRTRRRRRMATATALTAARRDRRIAGDGGSTGDGSAWDLGQTEEDD
uniref:Uncharacterized protein n=1 Tax=Oryza sativa subsp. japonica TaxID=39947 RepID=Q6I579_ORYSJ|nr:hypothetical protein [Oryza sativa Japonica Group]